MMTSNLCFQNDIHDSLRIISAGFFQILPVIPQWFTLHIQNLKKLILSSINYRISIYLNQQPKKTAELITSRALPKKSKRRPHLDLYRDDIMPLHSKKNLHSFHRYESTKHIYKGRLLKDKVSGNNYGCKIHIYCRHCWH